MSCSRCPKSRVSVRTILTMVALALLGVFVAEHATARKPLDAPAPSAPSR